MRLITNVLLAVPGNFQGFRAFYLQGERQHDVGLGELVLTLLAHVDDGSIVAALELLKLELATFGHRHALQVGHEQVDRGLQLLNVHVFHFFGYELGKFAFLAKQKKNMSRGVNRDLTYIEGLHLGTQSWERGPYTVWHHASKMFSLVEWTAACLPVLDSPYRVTSINKHIVRKSQLFYYSSICFLQQV